MEGSPRDIGKTQSRVLEELPWRTVAHRSLCFMPLVVIQRWQKARSYCQKPIRDASHPNPYFSFVRQGKTKGLTVLLFPLGFWRTSFILHSDSFPLFALNVLLHVSDLLLALSCGAHPIGAPAVNAADNWSWLVLRWQGGDGGPSRPPKVHV